MVNGAVEPVAEDKCRNEISKKERTHALAGQGRGCRVHGDDQMTFAGDDL